MQQKHDALVRVLAKQVKRFYEQKQPFRIYHGSTNSTRILRFQRSHMVDISDMDHVLSVDEEKRVAVVEPNVPMDKLAKATLKHGLVPEVVMEFPGITVGGGFQGGAGESSSFRYGCFNETCNWLDMLLPNGELTRISPKSKADLFYGSAGSFGTLGVITAAEVRLLPAKRYVQLTYLPVVSFGEAVDLLKQVVTQDYDYVDGIMFSKGNGVIIAGKLSDEKVGRVVRFTRAHDQWYYLHTESISKRGQAVTETVPIWDYLFRYDRGAFWVGRFAFTMFGVPYNPFTRWLLNPLFKTRKLYQALQESGASQQHIVQDLALPQDKATEFMEFVDTELSIYPLWLCPLKPDYKAPFQSNNLETPLVINVGVWGNIVPDREEFLQANRSIEQNLRQLGGKKWFYAHAYYSEQEFWSIYDKDWYDKLRRKYHAEYLPTIYDKVHVKETYPIELKRGALRTLWGVAKLRIEK